MLLKLNDNINILWQWIFWKLWNSTIMEKSIMQKSVGLLFVLINCTSPILLMRMCEYKKKIPLYTHNSILLKQINK